MNCQQESCGGEIDSTVSKGLVTDCVGSCKILERTLFNPCQKCGLLHNPNGIAAFQNGSGEGPFLMEGEVVYKEVILV